SISTRSSLLTSTFFSHCLHRVIYHCDLQSFPTRRSSDLALTRLVECLKDEPLVLSELVRLAMASIALSATWEALQSAEWRDEQLDRKSTRLNSSHGSISYAVFCLKKKQEMIGLHS